LLKAKRSGRWYRLRAWARIRKAILARDGQACQAFVTPLERTDHSRNLHVHHIVPERWIRRWMKGADAHTPGNLLTVCAACHGRLTAAEAPLFAGNWLEFRRLTVPGITEEQIETALDCLRASCKILHKKT